MPWISTESTNPHYVYHTRKCGAMRRIKPEHLRVISDEEALRQGKRQCAQCSSMGDSDDGCSIETVVVGVVLAAILILFIAICG